MICFNKDIKGEEVALLWVGMMMWCVVDKNIKEKAKDSCCTCFAPYNVRLLPSLLSKSNRFALPFLSVRDRGAIKKSNKNFVISQKMYYLWSQTPVEQSVPVRPRVWVQSKKLSN